MIPQRPYLLRALYEWIVDSDETPYVLVDASFSGVVVPTEHVVDGQIVLNISANAVRDLSLGDDYVMCSSRFGGRAFELCLPIMSIKAIYCKGSGQGMVFPEEAEAAQTSPTTIAAQPLDSDHPAGQFTERAAERSADKDDNADNKPGLRLV